MFAEIRDIAAVFGVPDRAETLIAGQQARIEKAKAGAKNAKVLWCDRGTDAPSVGACCGGPGMIMTESGATNAFADLTGSWADFSWETPVERNPDVIVLIDAGWTPRSTRRRSWRRTRR